MNAWRSCVAAFGWTMAAVGWTMAVRSVVMLRPNLRRCASCAKLVRLETDDEVDEVIWYLY